MHPLIASRSWVLGFAVVAFGCSARDASLGETLEPTPAPVQRCADVRGMCLEEVPGACSDGTWTARDCEDPSLSCCLPPAPEPQPCEAPGRGVCIAAGTYCRGRVETGPLYACGVGSDCCIPLIGTGSGGAGGSMPAAGRGGMGGAAPAGGSGG